MRRHSQVVRQRSAKPLFPGSNPGVASNMVGIVKWLRQRVVAPLCVGSNPTIHPIYMNERTLGYRQAVRQWILIPSCAGSNPATLANKKARSKCFGSFAISRGPIMALLKMLGWRILQGFQSLFHFLKKRCFHRLLREYPTDSLL